MPIYDDETMIVKHYQAVNLISNFNDDSTLSQFAKDLKTGRLQSKSPFPIDYDDDIAVPESSTKSSHIFC
ncbi:hypothetical protein FBU30_008895 [Linnemannia zychae]|nr:hypothetical protein FBU30_008895 [Linnemannia zychae]